MAASRPPARNKRPSSRPWSKKDTHTISVSKLRVTSRAHSRSRHKYSSGHVTGSVSHVTGSAAIATTAVAWHSASLLACRRHRGAAHRTSDAAHSTQHNREPQLPGGSTRARTPRLAPPRTARAFRSGARKWQCRPAETAWLCAAALKTTWRSTRLSVRPRHSVASACRAAGVLGSEVRVVGPASS